MAFTQINIKEDTKQLLIDIQNKYKIQSIDKLIKLLIKHNLLKDQYLQSENLDERIINLIKLTEE